MNSEQGRARWTSCKQASRLPDVHSSDFWQTAAPKSSQAFFAGAGSARSRTSQFAGGAEQVAEFSAVAQRSACESDLQAIALI
jgi:hypothetical protein